ncbi:MAG: thioredoxin family protein [Chloroflexi bacterium]|nr:thioredoxin family protein [Chloroflexota bacterium]
MIERIIITGILIIIGIAVYHLTERRTIHRAEKLAATDPILVNMERGKSAVLYFTADFCVACKTQQMPALQKLTDTLGDDMVQIIKVDAERQADVAERWGVMSLPTTFVLDTNGKPRAVNYGVASADKLIKQLQQA